MKAIRRKKPPPPLRIIDIGRASCGLVDPADAVALTEARDAEPARGARAPLGPCAKTTVTCTIVVENGVGGARTYYVGQNVCRSPQVRCPREPGEGYEKCASICDQVGHAEAVAASLVTGQEAAGGVAYVTGHTYACDSCKAALAAVGVTEVVIGPPPDHILPGDTLVTLDRNSNRLVLLPRAQDHSVEDTLKQAREQAEGDAGQDVIVLADSRLQDQRMLLSTQQGGLTSHPAGRGDILIAGGLSTRDLGRAFADIVVEKIPRIEAEDEHRPGRQAGKPIEKRRWGRPRRAFRI